MPKNKIGENMRKRVSIIGSDEVILDFAKQLLESSNYQLVYITTKEIEFNLLESIDLVYIDESLNKKYKEDLLNYCITKNKKLFIIPSCLEIAIHPNYQKTNDLLVYKIDDFKLTNTQSIIKRVIDIVFSILFIMIFTPIMLLIFLVIKILDRGPVIYCQQRLTKNKKKFILFKFRTMINNAEEISGITLSSQDDQRVTKVGRFLRKTRLDEIPQIFNVLIGDMSLIGPRPERLYYVEQFEKENPNYCYRFNVKAGITGLAQVNCRYNSKYNNKLKFDLLYISRFSFYNDLKILIKTIKILFDKNASEGTKEEKLNHILIKHKVKFVEIQPKLYELRKMNEKNSYQL